MRAHIARLVLMACMLASPAFLTSATPSPPSRTSQAPVAGPIPNTFGWQDELVDKLGDLGHASSIALDSFGYPHIAYYDFTNHSLKYAAWDGVAWTLDTVERELGGIDHVDSSYPIRSAIAFSGGNAYLAYEKINDATGLRYVRYAVGGPGGWNISTIAPTDNTFYVYAPTLRLDPNHNVHVSYSQYQRNLQFAPQSIIYARLGVTSTSWVTQTVETLFLGSQLGLVTSLALDSSNRPQIAYAPAELLRPSRLSLARWNPGNWLIQTVDLTATWPSLAVDPVGNPRIAYVDPTVITAQKLRYAENISGTWNIASLNAQLGSYPSLALDSSNRPRIAAYSYAGQGLAFLQWDGATWHTETLTDTADSPRDPALALDAVGNAHISYLDGNYQDLHAVTWASNWQTQTVAIAGDEAHLAVDLNSRPYVSYSTNPLPAFSHVQLANWTPGGYWHFREALPFSAAEHALRLEYAGNHQPLPIFSYIDLEDQPRDHLGFAQQWNDTTFFTQTVDGGDRAGFYSSLAFDNQANPIIGYLDLSSPHPLIKLATSSNYGLNWNSRTDTAAPTLGPGSGQFSLSAGSSIVCCNSYIAYFDTTSNALRLATWNGTQWTDERVDGGNGDVAGSHVSLVVDRTTGKPAMAYAANGGLRYAFWRGSAWLTKTVDSGVTDVSDLSLSLALYSDQYPRIAYTAKSDKSLRFAWSTSPTATWTIETVATLPTDPTNFPQARVSSQAQERDHIAFSSPSTGVVYAFHSATLPYSLYFNPLQPCVDLAPPDQSSLGRTLARVRALSPAALSQVDDLTTLRALRDLFELSPAGQHYIDLYYQYSHETGALALHDPALLWDAYRTLENFIPGFLALSAGRGYNVVISQAMVNRANDIADRLVTAGSPGLGAAINTERGKYNHLQAFVGLTFDDAARLIGVAGHALYLPLIRR